MSIIIFFEYL